MSALLLLAAKSHRESAMTPPRALGICRGKRERETSS